MAEFSTTDQWSLPNILNFRKLHDLNSMSGYVVERVLPSLNRVLFCDRGLVVVTSSGLPTVA